MAASNELVAVLIVAAMVISFAGTLTTLNVLSQVTSAPGITGFAVIKTGTTTAYVNTTTSITVTNATVAFGTLNPPELNVAPYMNDTTDGKPHAFSVRNDGTVNINISVNATALWSTQSSTSKYFQYKCGNATNEGVCVGLVGAWYKQAGHTLGPYNGFPWSVLNFTNMPINHKPVNCTVWNLSYKDDQDHILIHINVTVPAGESSGTKSSTVNFIAEQCKAASTFC